MQKTIGKYKVQQTTEGWQIQNKGLTLRFYRHFYRGLCVEIVMPNSDTITVKVYHTDLVNVLKDVLQFLQHNHKYQVNDSTMYYAYSHLWQNLPLYMTDWL